MQTEYVNFLQVGRCAVDLSNAMGQWDLEKLEQLHAKVATGRWMRCFQCHSAGWIRHMIWRCPAWRKCVREYKDFPVQTLGDLITECFPNSCSMLLVYHGDGVFDLHICMTSYFVCIWSGWRVFPGVCHIVFTCFLLLFRPLNHHPIFLSRRHGVTKAKKHKFPDLPRQVIGSWQVMAAFPKGREFLRVKLLDFGKVALSPNAVMTRSSPRSCAWHLWGSFWHLWAGLESWMMIKVHSSEI